MSPFYFNRSFQLKSLDVLQQRIVLDRDIRSGCAVYFSCSPPIGLGQRSERDLSAVRGDLEIRGSDERFPGDNGHHAKAVCGPDLRLTLHRLEIM
jgi:hypothetical protein